MRWVKLTLPCPVRLRYPLITDRFTSSSFAGMLRKLVAVGTDRLRSMLAAMATPAPRMGSPGSAAWSVAATDAELVCTAAVPVVPAAGVAAGGTAGAATGEATAGANGL